MWKKIPNTKNYISSNGEVKRPDGKITKGYLNKNGYLTASISSKKTLIHRLVAQAFIPNLNNLPQVNHIDGDKTNNHIDNLEWCDNTHNYNHAVSNGLISQRFQKGCDNINSKLSSVEVKDIRENNTITPKQKAMLYHIDLSTVYKIIKRKTY